MDGLYFRIRHLVRLKCYDLEHVYLGKVEKINRQAFTYCRSLEEITLPATTQWVDENAFPQGVKITCENKELIPFGNNGLHRAEYVSISGTRDYQKAYEVLALVNAERKKAGLGELKMEESLLDTAMVRGVNGTTKGRWSAVKKK